MKNQEVIPETGKPEEPTKPSTETKNTFKGCKGGSVNLSISCKQSEEFTFECTDNCGMGSKYTGYSSIQIGAAFFYSKGYSLTFNVAGEHIISVYKNGNLIENDKIIVAENHSWDNGNIKNKPTCTKNGKKKFICSNCENSYTEEIPATGHNYLVQTTKKASCMSDGVRIFTCSNCGNYYTTKITSSVSVKKKVSLNKGKTVRIKITKKSKGDTVSCWKSSKKSVATVNKKGKVTGKKKGTAKITVKMKSGCTATCTVTVK